MRKRFLIALVSAAATAGFSSCSAVGRHYAGTEPAAAGSLTDSASVLVDSKPSGAMIRLNGSQMGPGPVSIGFDLDLDGNLRAAVEISADYGALTPVRGVANVITVKLRRGEKPPHNLTIGRPAEGGIQRDGVVIPGI